MIHVLRRSGVEHWQAALGKVVKSVTLKSEYGGGGDSLDIRFEDGTGIRIRDEGQSCCESRYMTCDDDLSSFVGARLLDAEVRETVPKETEYKTHEVQFLVVQTSKGELSVCTHNEHNGYYGGFALAVEQLDHIGGPEEWVG